MSWPYSCLQQLELIWSCFWDFLYCFGPVFAVETTIFSEAPVSVCYCSQWQHWGEYEEKLPRDVHVYETIQSILCRRRNKEFKKTVSTRTLSQLTMSVRYIIDTLENYWVYPGGQISPYDTLNSKCINGYLPFLGLQENTRFYIRRHSTWI